MQKQVAPSPSIRKAASDTVAVLSDPRPLGLALGFTRADAVAMARAATLALRQDAAHAALEAAALAQTAIDCDRGLFDAHFALATARARLGQLEGAVLAFNEALSRQPDHLPSLVGAAEAEIACCRYALAAVHLKRAMTLDAEAQTPHGRRARMVLARTIAKLEKASKGGGR